jgi:predicted  nucleic acid-binding Zn-ribbon protein
MGKLVIICVALFVLAAGLVILTQAQDVVALYDAFRTEPLLDKVVWAIVLLVPLVLLPSSVLLWDMLVRQRKAAQALELRMGGVRQSAQDMLRSQADLEGVMNHLARTDPEDAIGAVQQRLVEAERVAQVQQGRNDMLDLQSRVDYLRHQQQALRERLTPVLDKRRSIEQLFAELDSRQSDIDRALAEIASGDDAVALDASLKTLTDFIKRSQGRCDDIERASKTLIALKEDYAALESRLVPFTAAEGGVRSRVRELTDVQARLAASVDALQQTPDGPLAERVQKFAGDDKKLDEGITHIGAQFSQLASLRENVVRLFANLNGALDALSAAKMGEGADGVDARINELKHFIDDTQGRVDDIERRMVVFNQLRTRLAELQTKFVPLESEQSGVVSLLGELRLLRDGLIWKIKSIEESDEGDLAERVKRFSEAKRELEERVTMLSEQCFRLAAIRKDIAGLFDKLSSAVSSSAG